ncbi:MAG TPA: sensor histidine kinase [Thermoanaerobaculia bacterium]|nr:sensor histidine kinase [Thermoanaerobaculia bacterium]
MDVIREPAGATTVLPPDTIGRREVDHRVANSLQLVSSLLSLQAKQSSDPSVQDALGAAAQRVRAVGAIHKQLHQSSSPWSIDIAGYLCDLAETIEQGFGGGVGRKRISAHVQSQMVSPDFASVLGILVTELVINACKHAYAPGEQGDIEISLFFPSRNVFRLEVRDFGGSSGDVAFTRPGGVGASIIQAICRRLSAGCTYLPGDEGTRCRVTGDVAS